MRNCELLWEYYKICDVLGDFCGFADVVSVLHPRLKLSYFKAACWEDEWIKTAEKVIRDEFEHMYLMDMSRPVLSSWDLTKGESAIVLGCQQRARAR